MTKQTTQPQSDCTEAEPAGPPVRREPKVRPDPFCGCWPGNPLCALLHPPKC